MIRPAIAVLISTILVFGTGEFAARWWIQEYGNALDITRRIVLIDPDRGWRQKANLDTTFLGFPLTTNEVGLRDDSMSSIQSFDGHKILVLGPSSAFGWGVSAADTYSAYLEDMMGGGESVKVINAGQIGYSSYQGLLYADEMLDSVGPGIVILAYGVNDLDRHRFYFQSPLSDAAEFARPHSRISLYAHRLVFSNALTSLMYKAAQSMRSSSPAVSNDVVRVSLEDFAGNMRLLAQKVLDAGALPIFVTTAVNMPTDFAASDEPQRIAEGVVAYNQVLRKLSQDMNVPIADIDGRFAQGIQRAKLFVDPVHFSPQGNEVVADTLFTIISTRHPLSL